MQNKKYVTPEYVMAEDIKNIRKKLHLTQKEFALLINTSQSTVERWEISKEPITGPVVLVVELLDRYPGFVGEITVPKKVYPLRLWYMHAEKVCSVIDVDERNKQVAVYNFTEDVMFKAFGNIVHPDYSAYEEFLESRCFPAGRDKMKLILEDLNLPFYDPFMIIEKTGGKMAEDDFWIRIER